MNQPPSRPTPRLRRRTGLAALAALGLLFIGSPAHAGWDDFDFGKHLIDRGYLDYAKRVFDGILANPKSTQAQKDEALFGTALLGKADLNAAQSVLATPFDKIREKLDKAGGMIQDFISKSPGGPKATEAKFALGGLHLGFVQWCSDQIERDDEWRANAGRTPGADPKDVGPLAGRGTSVDAVRSAASDAAAKAAETFSGIRETAKNDNDKQLAEFQFLSATYFKASALKKCSPEAVSSFQGVRKQLEDYAFANEQYITGTYALDFLGKTSMELADCENDAGVQLRGYQNALENYLAAANAGDQGDEHRKLMCTGFLHIAQLGLHLADRKDDAKYRPLLKQANDQLGNAVKQNAFIKKYRQGLFGMISWAEFQARAFETSKQAIEVLRQASDAAGASGFDDVKRRADSALRALVGGSQSSKSGPAEVVDVGVVIKVADDLYASGKFAEAVSAYQLVVSGAPKDKEGMVKYYLYGWARIGACYMQQKLPVEAAAAYDAIADEVRGGRVVLVSSEDALGKLVLDAFKRELAALKEVNERTADPAAKKRLDAFTDWLIAVQEKIPASAGSGGVSSDLAYARALDTFKGALAEKAKNPDGTEWKVGFKQALPNFELTGANFKSAYQDLAWVYIVRVPYELGEFDAVAPATDRALAFWETPESKKRAATEEAIGASRPAQIAAVAYWKAAALVGAKKDDAAMAILDGYRAKYGKDADFYLGWAMGLRVEILLRRGNIEGAESAINELIREFPTYHRLAAILAQQAEYYRGKESEVQKKIDDVVKKDIGSPDNRAAGAKQRLSQAYLDETNVVNVISDLLSVIARADAVLASPDATEGEKSKAKKDKEAAQSKLVDARAKLAKIREDIQSLTKLRADLAVEKAGYVREQIPFLRKTAELYRKLDDVFKDLDSKAGGGPKKRRSDNVDVLARRYYKLAKTDEADTSSWGVARSLYEDWLAFPDVKALPDSDPAKRRVSRLLGEIYYRMASLAATPDEKLVAAKSAVKYLEDGLCKLAVNTPLVLGNLVGDLVVLPWKDGDRTWRVPVRRMSDAKEFRDYVKEILSGGKVPKFVRETDDQLYQRAIGTFQRKVASMTDGELASTVASLKNGGFDAYFFADHADTDVASLFALAHSYQGSGVAADAGKAVAIAGVAGSKVEEDSAEWWEAESIKLDVRVTSAERALSAGGAAAPDAKAAATQARNQLTFMKQTHPHIGGLDRHDQTLTEWKDLQVRLNAALKTLGLPTSTVDLAAEAAPAPAEAPAPPAPAPAAPTSPPADAPKGDGPAMGDDAPKDK